MKSLGAALIIFLLSAALCIYIESYTSDAVYSMNSELEQIKIYMNAEETALASEAFYQFKKNWEKNEKIFQLMTEHNELDSINEQLAVLSSVFENSDYGHFREAIYTLSFYLKHVSEKKKINLITIL